MPFKNVWNCKNEREVVVFDLYGNARVICNDKNCIICEKLLRPFDDFIYLHNKKICYDCRIKLINSLSGETFIMR